MPIPDKHWTVMVYMAGDNSLDSAGTVDLNEMKRVGSTDQVNVIAQFDSATGHATKRYCLHKGGALAKDVVASLGATNTGDPKLLTRFIQWGVKNYPAEHYLLVLWNHGQGWDDTDIYQDARYRHLRRLTSGPLRHALFRRPVRRLLAAAKSATKSRAILLDDDAKDFIDNHELQAVLAGAAKSLGRKLDVLGMDACLMSMAEVGYQIHDSVDFTVGSEQTEPGNGWPYDTILTELAHQPDMRPPDVSKLIVKQYLASYRTADAVTQSACDLAMAAGLAQAVKGLATALVASLGNHSVVQNILATRARVQSFAVRDYVDLVDFCSILAGSVISPTIVASCQGVIQTARNDYVIARGSKGATMKNSHGVSIYFPTREVSPLYPGLDFSKQTGWDKFLKQFLTKIRGR